MNTPEKATESPKISLEKPETPLTIEAEPIAKEPEATVGISATPAMESASLAPVSAPASSTMSSSEQVISELSESINNFFKSLPISFSGDQKSIIAIIALALLSIPLLGFVSSTLSFINRLPLVAPLLELTGLGYVIWFVYRYLLFANTRQELSISIKEIKGKILG